MLNPMQAWTDWCSLSLRTAQLSWEAQSIIAIRLMRLAGRGQGNQTEARRMVTEKVAALSEAQSSASASASAATAVIKGGKSHRVAKKVLGVYKKRVRANRRRLTRK
jgi:hypothetical protein